MVTIAGIPVYDALITDEETRMFRISLVDDPAVMSNFQAFANEKKQQMYSVQDEQRRLVRGVVMRADFPIYRCDAWGEYYVIYKAEQIRKMAEKYLVESRQNEVNLMHQEGSEVDGVQMVQFFIKGDGIQVSGFDDIADGSLMAEFHITNDAVWSAIQEGTYKGFSLEGVFELAPEEDAQKTEDIVTELEGNFNRIFKHSSNNIMSKLSRLKAALAKALQEFGNITTDKGILAWDGEEDLQAGDAVYIEDAEGNRTPAEDGEYKTEDGKVIVVVEGKVAEIKDAEVEVVEAPATEEVVEVVEAAEETEEAPATEEEAPAEDKDETIKALEEKIAALEADKAALEAENAELKDQVAKMQKMSAAMPAHEAMQTSTEMSKTGNKAIDNLARILSAK